MYDTIKFVIKESELDNKICFLEEIPCRISVDYNSLNRVVGHLSNMRVEVRGTVLIVEGSLLKYLKGYNYADSLFVWGVRIAVNKFSNALNVPMRLASIRRIDFGICFSMNCKSWTYFDYLLHSNGYHRSNIEKTTLYFSKHDLQLCFYDKRAEMKKHKEFDGLEDIQKLEVLRYELRFKKVSSFFGRVVRGSDLYNSAFYLSVLEKWYDSYMVIRKGVDMKVNLFRFGGKKEFQRSCVAFVMNQFNLYEFLEKEFDNGKINSKNKYDIKEVMKDAGKLILDEGGVIPVICELTDKVHKTYEYMKGRVENLAPCYRNFLDKTSSRFLKV